MVKSADRTLQIFEIIGARGQLKHGDIVGLLDIPKSSATVLLETLTGKGYLNWDPATRLYSLGPQIVTLAGRYLSELDIVRISQPVLRELTGRIDEASFLLCRDGDEVIVMWREICTQPLTYTMSLGERAALTTTSAGLAIMAFMAAEDRPRAPRGQRHPPPIEPRLLERQLENVRRGGVAQLRDALASGVVSLGMPVFDHLGKVNAAVTIAIPSNRFKAQNMPAIEKELRQAGNRISEQLGYRTAGPSRQRS